MLKLNILKPVVIVGQEYKAGDTVEVNKTLIHREVKAPSAIQALLNSGAVVAVGDNYKVVADIIVIVAGQEYKKNAEFSYPDIFDYVDEIDYPSWIVEGVTSGHWSLGDGEVIVTGVSIDHPTFSVEEGKTFQLEAVIVPVDATDKQGVWASSDATVATVDQEGVVTAVKAGTANITFTSEEGGIVGTSVGTVTIKVIAPTSVAVSPTSPTVAVAGTVKLTASVSPASATDKSGVWASATPAVATVAADGTVTGVSAGTSVISFTTTLGAKTANRTVTVTA